jgi:hypothetical protein
MKILTTTALVLISASLLSARPADRGQGPGDNCAGACAIQTGSPAPLALGASAQAALRLQIDEERMAGELYRAFGEKWDARPFKNIPRAEARHRQLLENLATRAGLAPAKTTNAGRFETRAIQARYDALLARGRTSLNEALMVGALVEEQDIADLWVLAAATDSPELKSVVTALEQGSRHHLNALVRNLRARGIDYVAQVLSTAEVEAITAAAPGRPERGRANQAGWPGRQVGRGLIPDV